MVSSCLRLVPVLVGVSGSTEELESEEREESGENERVLMG